MPDQTPKTLPMDDDELILYFYDELPAERRQALRAQLLDPALWARYDALCTDLQTIEQGWEAHTAGEIPADIGARAWEGVAERLAATTASTPPPPAPNYAQRYAVWTALAASVLIGVATVSFQAGQRSALPGAGDTALVSEAAEQSSSPVPTGSGVQERVLLAQVQRHLGASERLLVDVSNQASLQATALGGSLGMSEEALEAEKQWARTLLTANRLYRFAAERAGQDRLSSLLGDLEPILIDLANGSRGESPQYADALRESIATRELLPRVRAVQADSSVPARMRMTEFPQEQT